MKEFESCEDWGGRMNKTKIEWCDSTLNSVVGCTYGCPYCYARKNEYKV